MRTDTKSRYRIKAGGNVFLDLGFPLQEAKRCWPALTLEVMSAFA
jgi:hypothetical protein